MELYILRHGEAEPRDANRADEDRALTAKGKRQIRAVLRQTRQELDIHLILTSPLCRAAETAEIARSALGCPLRFTDTLKPEADASALWKELCKEPADSVLLVGHQPHLGHLIAFLLGAPIEVDLKKGALVRIDCTKRSKPKGILRWFLIPRLL